METGRIEAFSDGVFAIAITLLTLDIHVPDLGSDRSSAALWQALTAGWPSYLAFVTSFATILIMWINHHGIFREIRGADSLLMFANGFLLLLVAATPFPTALVARYLTQPAAPLACAIYAGFYVLINVGFDLVWLSVGYRRRLLKPSISDAAARLISGGLAAGFVLYSLAAAVAFVSPLLSLAIVSTLWLFWSWFAVHRHGFA